MEISKFFVVREKKGEAPDKLSTERLHLKIAEVSVLI
jgi:hypothetical protein